MARPHKVGLDYFPLDVQCCDKIGLIESEFGLLGFGIIVRLWQLIYRQQGYYTEWNDDVMLMFAKNNCVGVNVVSEVVKASVFRRGIFDKTLYEKHGILTSVGIQKRYLEVASRRAEVSIKPEYRLIVVNHNSINVDNNRDNVDNNRDNDSNNATKESKLKESKLKYGSGHSPTTPTLDEIEKYCKDNNLNVDYNYFYKYFSASNWVDSKGNKVLNWQQKLLSWNNFEPDTIRRRMETKAQKRRELGSKALEEFFKDFDEF